MIKNGEWTWHSSIPSYVSVHKALFSGDVVPLANQSAVSEFAQKTRQLPNARHYNDVLSPKSDTQAQESSDASCSLYKQGAKMNLTNSERNKRKENRYVMN